jgi:hypothetical protein
MASCGSSVSEVDKKLKRLYEQLRPQSRHDVGQAALTIWVNCSCVVTDAIYWRIFAA